MIEQLMSRSLPGDHQGHAAGLVGLHVGSPFPATPSSTITAMFSLLPWYLHDGQEINGRRCWLRKILLDRRSPCRNGACDRPVLRPGLAQDKPDWQKHNHIDWSIGKPLPFTSR